MKETSTWLCDTCGEPIERVEDGWVEWILVTESDDRCRGRDLRLVHHVPAGPRGGVHGCQFDGDAERDRDGGAVRDLALCHFLGPDGLMYLLSFIAEGQLPVTEVLEMVKRLHVPGYEHARPYFEGAICAEVFVPSLPEGYYRQSDIRATLQYAEQPGHR